MSTSQQSPFHRHQFANGLTLVVEQNPHAHTAAIGFFARVGGRDEDPAIMGVSHFLEHMMFKGTARRTADDVNREFDEIGADYNAYTSQEMTVYYAQVLPEYFPRAVDLLGDMFRPALRDDDFNMEKNVILEEISMYEDRPQSRMQDLLIETYFAGHPLSHRVLGTAETVAGMSVESMRTYFQNRYSPDNIVIAAAGRFDLDALIADIEKVTGHWQPTGVTRFLDPPVAEAREVNLVDETVARHYISLLCPGPSAQDPRRYAAAVLSHVLGDVEGSRLYWSLVDPGLSDEADFEHYAQDHAGSFCAFAACHPDDAEEVESILLGELDHIRDGVDEHEVRRAKHKLATETTLSGESPGGRMRALGNNWAYLQRYIPLKEDLDMLMAVTPDDVHALLKDMPLSPRTIVRLGPGRVRHAQE